MQKYKALCRDNGAKQIYLNPLEDVLVEFNGEDMDYALMRLSFSKATGWDFIPGMVFKLIMDETKHKLCGRSLEFSLFTTREVTRSRLENF